MKKILYSAILFLMVSKVLASKPSISFFCELNSKEFSELFSDTALIRQLAEMKCSVRVGLHDFSPERTQVIQTLNKAGILVYAWILLPESEGYWFNMYNGDKATRRYEEFKAWSHANNLKWEGIGLDLEMDINDAQMALHHKWKLAWNFYKRLYAKKAFSESKKVYQTLIQKMEGDGYAVESYIIPVIFLERSKNTESFQKLYGVVDIKTRTEIPMLYTSALGNPAIIPLFHQKYMPVALGSTGGGVKIEGIELPSLSWEDLERDLIISSKLTDKVIVFCLETSVHNNFLEKIQHIDWNQPAADISVQTAKMQRINKFIGFILVVLDHPLLLTLTIILLSALLAFAVYKLIRLFLYMLKRPKIRAQGHNH